MDEVLPRRANIAMGTWDRGLSAAPEVAARMAGPMKWRTRQVTREVDHYRARIEAERKSQEADTDTDADAIRLGAPEIVPVVLQDPGPRSTADGGGPGSYGAAASGASASAGGGASMPTARSSSPFMSTRSTRPPVARATSITRTVPARRA